MEGVKPAARRAYAVAMTYVIALIPAAVALNVVGSLIRRTLNLPVFLDMIGTAVVAMTVGPWWGALAGAMTNTILGFIASPITLPFAVSNVTGALVWGYGVRWGMGKTHTRFFILSLLVALAVTLSAVPIYVFIFGGATGHFSDVMTAAFLGMGQRLVVAVFSSNILVSLADKIFSSYIALAILDALPPALTMNLDVAKSEGMKRVAWIAGGVILSVALTLVFLALA